MCVHVQEELGEVRLLQNIEDKAPLASHLIPMLDAMVAAHAETFYGTPRLIFSTYITNNYNLYMRENQLIFSSDITAKNKYPEAD